MAASDTLGLIVAGAIGAGGAVAAQIISSVVTSRKDSKRFDWERDERKKDRNWEREKQEREWKMQEAERFLDIKREMYGRLNRVVRNLISYIYRPLDPPEVARQIPIEFPNLEELDIIRNTLDLICEDDLAHLINMSIIKLLGTQSITGDEELPRKQREQEADEAREMWFQAFQAMKQDLAGRYVPPNANA